MRPSASVRKMLEDGLSGVGAHSFRWKDSTLRFRIPKGRAVLAAQGLVKELSLDLSILLANDLRPAEKSYQLIYLFSKPEENWFVEMEVRIDDSDLRFDSVATVCYPASRYEREIRDLFGLIPDGHPDLRPLVRHGFWPEDYYPLRKGSAAPENFKDDGRPFPFYVVQGEGVYEIPVGPVHAGVIEPGHFRFSADGETIIDMKSRLYFTHKGTEKLFEGRSPEAGIELAERISGDTSVGHCLAYCQALEALAQSEAPPRAQYLRVVLLEMERLYNHVADFGAIANDTGFALGHAHCMRIRERLLRLDKALTGHRLLRGALAPGGMKRDLPDGLALERELNQVQEDFNEVVDICWGNSMLRDRLRGTGRLTERTARDHGVLGYVARASGIDRDVRRDHPFAAYDRLQFRVPVFAGGDVEARTLARVEEFRESVGLIQQALQAMPAGAIVKPLGPLPPWEHAFGLVEGWRGAILHWVMVDGDQKLYRVKIKDPSFVNWRPLSFALLKNIVPDFPLCNKSFNLSYSGNDL